MKVKVFLTGLAACLLLFSCENRQNTGQLSLKDAFDANCLIGVAMNEAQIYGTDTAGLRIIKQHFNSVVAEDCMKSEKIQPGNGVFDFAQADKLVEFGEQNDMPVIGHTLIWHSQLPEWFIKDENGNDVSKEELTERMRAHIHTVVGRYKGRIKGWNVVNEAFNDDGTLRETPFMRIIGEDYIRMAFEFTREADPDTELYYNDYSLGKPAKCSAVIDLVRRLKEQGVKIDGIGMQGHLLMDYPDVADCERSIIAFAEEGLEVMVTELDFSVLPSPKFELGAEISSTFEYSRKMNPYTEILPDSAALAWNRRFLDFFDMYQRHRDKISRITLWGVSDSDSWKNNWPISGRTDYPLLFDRAHNPKPIVKEILGNLE